MPDTASKRGWTRVAFGEMAENVTERVEPTPDDGQTYVGLEHLDSGSLTVRRWGTEVALIGTKLRMRKGDILFAKRNAYLRRVALAPHDGLFSAHGMVLRARPQVVLPEFLPFFMQSDLFMERAKEISVGSLSPTINWKTLAKEEFALPPLQEQARIAAALAVSEATTTALSNVVATANAVRQSIFKTCFLQARSEIAKTRIGDIADVRNGTTPSRARADYWGGDIPWLPTGKVNERRISSPDEWITHTALKECSLSVIPAGATLVAMIGQGTTRGRAAFLEIDATINQNFAAVIPGDDVLPSFLFYQLEALYEGLRNWSQGSNQLALNCRLVSEFPIYVPNKSKQREISEYLETLDEASSVVVVRKRVAHRVQKRLAECCLVGDRP